MQCYFPDTFSLIESLWIFKFIIYKKHIYKAQICFALYTPKFTIESYNNVSKIYYNKKSIATFAHVDENLSYCNLKAWFNNLLFVNHSKGVFKSLIFSSQFLREKKSEIVYETWQMTFVL